MYTYQANRQGKVNDSKSKSNFLHPKPKESEKEKKVNRKNMTDRE